MRKLKMLYATITIKKLFNQAFIRKTFLYERYHESSLPSHNPLGSKEWVEVKKLVKAPATCSVPFCTLRNFASYSCT